MAQRTRLDFLRRPDGDDAALIDDGHAVAQLFRFFDVVRSNQDGALLPPQVGDQLVNLEARLRIEPCGRLVEEQQLRIVEKGQRQGEALFLAAGQRAVERVALLPQREALEQRVAIDGLGVEIAKQVDGFANLDFFRQVGRLQTDADAILELFALRAGVESQDGDGASAARTQSFQNLDGRGFSGPVRTEEPENLTGADFKIDTLDSLEVAVVLGEGCDLDDWILNESLAPASQSLT